MPSRVTTKAQSNEDDTVYNRKQSDEIKKAVSKVRKNILGGVLSVPAKAGAKVLGVPEMGVETKAVKKAGYQKRS